MKRLHETPVTKLRLVSGENTEGTSKSMEESSKKIKSAGDEAEEKKKAVAPGQDADLPTAPDPGKKTPEEMKRTPESFKE